MLEALLGRDASYDGIFVTGVTTTGIFCRPSCAARKPHPGNVTFFGSAAEARSSGYRPCKRCRPLEPTGAAPAWLDPLLKAVESDPARRWTDADLQAYGYSPTRVRRWFKDQHGMTFHAYSRARRLGMALGRVRSGDSVARAAFDAGYDSLSGFQEAFGRQFGSAPTALEDATPVSVVRLSTPLGAVVAGATADALCLLEFADRSTLPTQLERLRRRIRAVYAPGRSDVLGHTADQLREYFEGRRRVFHLPLLPAGTDFQRSVWNALRSIPFGETRSYAEVAAIIGRPKAVRPVGRANGLNALAIVIPCHRVVGSDGRPVGYGGGLWRKERLLELEREGPGRSR